MAIPASALAYRPQDRSRAGPDVARQQQGMGPSPLLSSVSHEVFIMPPRAYSSGLWK